MILHGSSTIRVLSVLVVIAVVLSLWIHHSLSTDHIFKSWLVPPSFGSNSSSYMNLSDVFFPVSDSPTVNPLARENSKMLHALVTCIEHRHCHQNQTKGLPYLLAFLFLDVIYHLNSRHIGFFVLSRLPPGFERWRVNLVRVPDPGFILQVSHLARQGTLHSTWLILEIDCP